MTIDQAVARVRDRDVVKTREDAAAEYADVLLTYWLDLDTVDVKPLLTAMLERWSLGGLAWIKRAGWKEAQRLAPLRGQREDEGSR
jgi:hypothetical protein